MSKLEVNTVAPQCGTTLTLGESGDTVTLGTGASQSGFGRTGTVDWETTPKTATFTGVNGKGYFCNTTAGAFEIDLPAGSAGAIISVQDYNNTFDSYGLTVDPNGSEKINGGVAGASIILATEGQGVTFVYVDSTVGWRSIHESQYADAGSDFIAATGGCIATSGDYKIHKFTGPGTFTVTASGSPGGSDTVEYLVVAGGGGGGGDLGGGGGAGGYRTTFPSPATGGLPVSVTSYSITVGAGGTAPSGPNPGAPISASPSGSNTIFSSITSAGGGGGGQSQTPFGGATGLAGGSGGGSGGYTPASGGSGNTPSTPVSQGNDGGAGGASNPTYPSGGGGGAGAVGARPTPGPSASGGAGGAGTQNNIDGNNYYWSGGGGGGTYQGGTSAGNGGLGGGGGGGRSGNPTCAGAGGGSAINAGSAGTGNNPETNGVQGGAAGANSGGGGGGGAHNGTPGVQSGSKGGNGGSGIVIIRYKFQ